MILHYFKNKDKKIADFLYLNMINYSQKIINHNLFNPKKDFNVSFEINSIILIAIFIGSKNRYKKDWVDINQDIMNIFIRDLDHSLRLSGISDMKIGKYVKGYIKKFYFRIKEFEKIYENNDFSIFYKYLLKLQILKIDNNQALQKDKNTKELKKFFLELKILLKRSQMLKNEELLFKDLFK